MDQLELVVAEFVAKWHEQRVHRPAATCPGRVRGGIPSTPAGHYRGRVKANWQGLHQAQGGSQGAQIRIRFLAKPGVIAMDGVTAVLEVANGTGSVLSSMGGYPVFLSYHWLAQDGSVACFEGVRTELFPPLPSGGVHAYDVHVTPPSAPGRYTLRVTLVQEGVVWLDHLGVFADTECLIMPAS
jgi:hypothetical protein